MALFYPSRIGALYFGSKKIREAYLGSQLVYRSGLPVGTTLTFDGGARSTVTFDGVDRGTWSISATRSYTLYKDGVSQGQVSSFVSRGEKWSATNSSSLWKISYTVTKTAA